MRSASVWVFEPCARLDMVYLYLAWMKWFRCSTDAWHISAQIVPLSEMTSSRRSIHPCLSS